MKLLKRNISEKDGTGSVTLRAEEPEDMWHVFNLIHKGDVLKTTTVRKVVKEGATGSTSSQRLRMSLALEIDHIDFDPAKCLLRIKGINVEENPHVRVLISSTAPAAHCRLQKVKAQLEDTKAAGDVKCLDTFFEMLHSDQDRAYYGYNHVVRANDQNAVETLLIADSLFRSQDVQTRRKYVTLVEKVRENGGLVRVFSSLHVSGEKLAQLSGIAAILRMPLPELEEDGDSDDDNDIAADVLATADSTVGDLDDLEYI
ncbi:hypothetical protein DYB32_009203 [Aphanomyces invadans]|uniref:eRF1/Pelota-like N-terminal domain-containing protein n=1 Tax=Aphanomyces invadans TaxID=157072 RepID=A0A418AJ15_9STRA|nr:hypothetical protein DYB32_009203 [Aphanomyces invadans]